MIIGHQLILNFLKKSVKNDRLAHAYLFIGPAHLGKKTVALEFIRMLNGKELDQAVHPDILIVEPEVIAKGEVKKELEIGIDKAKKIQHQMSLAPYQAKYKIVLIDQADQMTTEASNCLLKTLEEPSGRAILILISSNPHKLLSTIVSRCQSVKFLLVAKNEIEKGLKEYQDKDCFGQAIRLANGRPGLAIAYLKQPELLNEQNQAIDRLEKLLGQGINERYRFAEEISKDIPRARQILNYWLFWFRDLILLKNNCSDLTLYPNAKDRPYQARKAKQIIEQIKRTDSILSNASFNARLALEVLMLEF